MSERPSNPNAAQLRSAIDRGETGDKVATLDPAAAPLETDSEAGGAPPAQGEVADALANERRPGKGPYGDSGLASSAGTSGRGLALRSILAGAAIAVLVAAGIGLLALHH